MRRYGMKRFITGGSQIPGMGGLDSFQVVGR